MTKPIDADLLAMLSTKILDIDVLHASYDKHAFDQWHTETKLLLEHIFGEESDKVATFDRYDGSLGVFWAHEDPSAREERYKKAYFSDLEAASSFLTGLYNFLEKISKKSVEKQKESMSKVEQEIPASEHTFHPVIAEEAGPLFNDGHYRDAIRAAFIEVIDQVKNKTGRKMSNNGKKELDGDDLMNQAFAQESHEPMLYWSDRKTDAEKSFQQGMFLLFKGLVALRNEKGHVNVRQKDKERAFEYLCLASLLLRQLDDAKGAA